MVNANASGIALRKLPVVGGERMSAFVDRDATHAHRLLTAAPLSLERLHLCCKGSCEFGSLRTVLLRILTTVKFLILQKQKPTGH